MEGGLIGRCYVAKDIEVNASYELTTDDLVAFTQFHTSQSPAARKQRVGCLTLAIVAMLLLPGLILLTTDKPILETALNIWPLILGPLLLMILAPPYIKWRTRSLSTRILNEGENSEFNGDCSMSLDDTGIRESKASGDTFRNWSAVQRIVTSTNHLFIYTSGIEAFVVPKRAFDTDDGFNTFVQAIADRSGATVEPV